MNLKIDVTQADIDKANELISTTADPISAICPVALAAKREMNQPIVVGKTGIFDKKTLSKYIVLPTVAKEFIDDFDNGLKVKPFTFEVQV